MFARAKLLHIKIHIKIFNYRTLEGSLTILISTILVLTSFTDMY